jgi:hypothetical protein
MLRLKSSRLNMAVPVVAAIILVAGGVAIASNMGFKMHKGLAFTSTGQTGNNLTSLPFRSPYNNAGVLCTQTGLTSTGLFRAVVVRFDAVTGAPNQASCGTAGATALTLSPGLGAMIRQPVQCSDASGSCSLVCSDNTGSCTSPAVLGGPCNDGTGICVTNVCSDGTGTCPPPAFVGGPCSDGTGTCTHTFGRLCGDGTGTCTAGPGVVTAAGSSIHIVGSHDPALTLNITRSSAGTGGSFLYATVLHATATNKQELCNQIGMTNTGLLRGTVLRLRASDGTPIQTSCGTAASAAEALVLGEAYLLRQPLICSDNTGLCTGIAFGLACSDGSGTCTAGTPVGTVGSQTPVLPFTPQHF